MLVLQARPSMDRFQYHARGRKSLMTWWFPCAMSRLMCRHWLWSHDFELILMRTMFLTPASTCSTCLTNGFIKYPDIFFVTSSVHLHMETYNGHKTLPSSCMILKVIRAGAGWVWLARLITCTCDCSPTDSCLPERTALELVGSGLRD